MTPAELKALIESDAEATALANAGNDEACAVRCGVIAPQVRVETVLTERGLYDRLGATTAETILQKLEGFSVTQDPLASVVKRFLRWLEPVNGGADWGQPEALQMCHALMLGGLLTEAECTAINNLSLTSQRFIAAQIGEAWRS